MEVSVIIVNYNTVKLLLDAVASIYEKTKDIDFEIIVVDNNSTDNSQQLLSENFPKVVFVKLSANIGFGRANNKGAQMAKGQKIFFLNPDTLLVNNAIKILSDELDRGNMYGVIGGNLYDANGKPCHSHNKRFPGVLTELDVLFGGLIQRLFLSKNREFNYTNSNIEVAFITGADLMITKDLFCRIGGFNHKFFMYYEETELCWRVKKDSYKIINTPKAKIMHLEGGSFSAQKSLSRLERVYKGREVYYKLTSTKLKKSIADFIVILVLLRWLPIYFLTFNRVALRNQLERLKIFRGAIRSPYQ